MLESEKKEKALKPLSFKALFGADYWTRTSDLMRVKYSRAFAPPFFFAFRCFSLIFSLSGSCKQPRTFAVTNKKLTIPRRLNSGNKLLGIRMNIDTCRGGIAGMTEYLLKRLGRDAGLPRPARVGVPRRVRRLFFYPQAI